LKSSILIYIAIKIVLFQLVALTRVESSNIPEGLNDLTSRKETFEKEGLKEIPDLWTTFTHSLTQKKRESFSHEATKQQVEEFIFIESEKEEEDRETWASVSLSSSTQTSSEGSTLGTFLLEF
jgi:hypothetical protein